MFEDMKKKEIEMGDNFKFLTSMYGLEEKGIKVQVKDLNSKKKSRVLTLGRYKPFRNKILFLEEMEPYWFIALKVIVHEYRHYQQRKQMFVSLGTELALCIISFSLGSSIYFRFIIPAICMALIILSQEYFEWDARRCVARHLGVEIRFQDTVEELLLVQGLEDNSKVICKLLKKLHRLIKATYPSLTN